MIKLRFDKGMGGFATLLALVPWEILKALGWSEEHAAYAAGALLFLAACGAIVWSRKPSAQRAFPISWLREDFRVDNFLLSFAGYALALLALYGGLWVFFLMAEP